jgi:magnesium chelatase subunit I
MSVTNTEAVVASALRRSLRLEETTIVPRVGDLDAVVATTAGKIEFETLEDGHEAELLDHLVSSAVHAVFRELVPAELYAPVVDAFEDGVVARTGDDITVDAAQMLVSDIPALSAPVQAVLGDEEGEPSAAMVASAVEFVLEGLHLAKRLNKESSGGRTQYLSRSV